MEQIEGLTNISRVENLNLTVGDVLLLIETVNEVIDGDLINVTVSVYESFTVNAMLVHVYTMNMCGPECVLWCATVNIVNTVPPPSHHKYQWL